MIFESHAHYDDEHYDEDRKEVIESLQKNGIEYVINIGSSIKTTKSTLELIREYPFFYGAAGVHPNEALELNEENFAWLEKAVKTDKIVAVGEIGLDYYYDQPEKQIQKIWFERQIELAKKVKLPIVIHSRDAAKDTYDIIVSSNAREVGGVVHCFSYSVETAKQYLDLGFYIGVGGVVTFKNAKKLIEAVKYIPIDRILLETDCPYLAPVPYRGKRNTSLYIPYIAQEIANIKGLEYDYVVETTAQNTKKLFNITQGKM